MLQSTRFKYVKGDVISFKLVNGEEIVATLGEETDTVYVLDDARSVFFDTEGNLQLGQGFATADPDRPSMLNKSTVVMHTESHEAVVKAYKASISKIIQP